MLNYKLEREVKNTAGWEKSIKEAKVRNGLQYHLWKRRRKEKEEKKEKKVLQMH